MTLGPNGFYIATAYGVTALVFSSLIVWTVFDYRRQRRAVTELEAQRGGSHRVDTFKDAAS